MSAPETDSDADHLRSELQAAAGERDSYKRDRGLANRTWRKRNGLWRTCLCVSTT